MENENTTSNSIEELKSITSEIEDDIIKPRKKEKKKKKKSKFMDDRTLDMLMDTYDVSEDSDSQLTDEDLYLLKKKPKAGKKKDLFDAKAAKKNRKKNLEAKFNPELANLRKILRDADSVAADVKEIFDNLKGTKTRYASKGLTDLIAVLNTANSNRASIVREISNIKKSIVDLSLKQEKANPKKEEKNVDAEEFGNNIFQSLLSNNRKEIIRDAQDYYHEENKSPHDEDSFDYDPFDDISTRLENAEDKYRSKEGDAYIKYEKLQPSDVVFYHDDDNWEIDAVDRDGNVMPDDYPRLDGDTMRLNFDLEQCVAIDNNTGRKIKIIKT